ncbi:hypothetical protein HZS_6837 [Henneguya salminicola]|nr:hypothetical protein HZS_6837 [Henneguya salminicola]
MTSNNTPTKKWVSSEINNPLINSPTMKENGKNNSEEKNNSLDTPTENQTQTQLENDFSELKVKIQSFNIYSNNKAFNYIFKDKSKKYLPDSLLARLKARAMKEKMGNAMGALCATVCPQSSFVDRIDVVNKAIEFIKRMESSQKEDEFLK